MRFAGVSHSSLRSSGVGTGLSGYWTNWTNRSFKIGQRVRRRRNVRWNRANCRRALLGKPLPDWVSITICELGDGGRPRLQGTAGRKDHRGMRDLRRSENRAEVWRVRSRRPSGHWRRGRIFLSESPSCCGRRQREWHNRSNDEARSTSSAAFDSFTEQSSSGARNVILAINIRSLCASCRWPTLFWVAPRFR